MGVAPGDYPVRFLRRDTPCFPSGLKTPPTVSVPDPDLPGETSEKEESRGGGLGGRVGSDPDGG